MISFLSYIHRVIVGGLLGLGAVIWGIVSLINKSGGLGITILIVGFFLLWTTYNLYKSIASEQIIHHPIFAPDCYRPHRRENATSYVGGGRNNRVSSPPSASASPRKKGNSPRTSKGLPTKKNDKTKKQKKMEVGSSPSADTSDDSFGVDVELGGVAPLPKKNPTTKKPAVKKTKKKKPTPPGAKAAKKNKPSLS